MGYKKPRKKTNKDRRKVFRSIGDGVGGVGVLFGVEVRIGVAFISLGGLNEKKIPIPIPITSFVLNRQTKSKIFLY